MSTKSYTFLAMLFAALQWPHSAGALSCDELLPRLVPLANGSEARLLADFRPSSVVPNHFVPLSENGVMKIRDANGIEYVVRFQSEGNDTVFEGFANLVVRGAPGIHALRTRLLSAEETQALCARIGGNTRLPAGTRATVALFLPTASGESHLAEMRVIDGVRSLLVRLSREGLEPDDYYFTNRELQREWAKLTARQQANLREDIRSLVPATRAVADADFLTYLSEHLGRLPRAPIRRLIPLGLSRLEPALETQLADLWALYTALGIPDSHMGNWLVHDGRVIAIDLARPGPELAAGTATLRLAHAQHPIGLDLISSAMRERLITKMSPAMVAYLRELTPERLAALAEENRYPSTPLAIRGIRGRIDAILAARGEP